MSRNRAKRSVDRLDHIFSKLKLGQLVSLLEKGSPEPIRTMVAGFEHAFDMLPDGTRDMDSREFIGIKFAGLETIAVEEMPCWLIFIGETHDESQTVH